MALETLDRFSKRLGTWALVRSLPAIAELAVGFSLIAIGAFGISEARSWKPDSDLPDNVMYFHDVNTRLLAQRFFDVECLY